MNKKLFFAGFALLAAVSFTSCNSDNPIDVTDPSGVRPASSTHYLGGSYDWTAIVKDYAELQTFWAADKDAVKKALADKNAKTANILIDVTGYELKATDVITLPNFWGAGANTNGNVVNITFQGNFKNADFERAAQIAGAPITKFPVQINTNNLKSAEVNFTFNVEKFDLLLNTRDARSTLSGDFTIGYMFGAADVKTQDAIELKSGTVEGVDMTSTGKYKGTFNGVWTKNATDNNIESAKQAGIKLNSGETLPGAKDVYVEVDATIDSWYTDSGWKSYTFGTVKFVSGAEVQLKADHGGDVITKVQGFNKQQCFLKTADNEDDLDNIAAIEKTSIKGSTLATATTPVVLIKDVYTDVEFFNDVYFSTSVVNKFENVTFWSLYPVIPEDGVDLTFNGVNFWEPVDMQSAITVKETAKTQSWEYQWIVDNSNPLNGHFEEVTNAAPLLDTNKDKELVEYDYALIHYDGTTQFVETGTVTDAKTAAKNAANKCYRVKITRTWEVGTTYIPEDVDVILDENCKFSDNGVTTGGAAELLKTNRALNYVWGDKQLYDEECWYDVNYAGVDHYWKKATWGTVTGAGSARFVLTPVAAN